MPDCKSISKVIGDHFTVVCLVARPLNENEAGYDLVLIKKPHCFSYENSY